jgi:hypothetical protein
MPAMNGPGKQVGIQQDYLGAATAGMLAKMQCCHRI